MRLPVLTPKVGCPTLRECGRPRNATATASPELAVFAPVTTTTGAVDRSGADTPGGAMSQAR